MDISIMLLITIAVVLVYMGMTLAEFLLMSFGAIVSMLKFGPDLASGMILATAVMTLIYNISIAVFEFTSHGPWVKKHPILYWVCVVACSLTTFVSVALGLAILTANVWISIGLGILAAFLFMAAKILWNLWRSKLD